MKKIQINIKSDYEYNKIMDFIDEYFKRNKTKKSISACALQLIQERITLNDEIKIQLSQTLLRIKSNQVIE